MLVATSTTTLRSLNASNLQLQRAIEDTNLATAGLFVPGPGYDAAPAKALARLVLTKRVCDYGEDHGILATEPSQFLRGYRDLVIDGLGVSVGREFKQSFAIEYHLSERIGDRAKGERPDDERLRAMREARAMTVECLGAPRSSGNIHFLQRAYTNNHHQKLDYFVASSDYDGEGKLGSLIFAPYTGRDARDRVIRRIDAEVPTTFVSAGNLANLLTIKRLEPLEPLDPGAVFALRVLVWCTLVGCEFNDEGRDTLSVSKQGDESLPVEYSVRWSSDADHTAIVSNNRNDPSTEFKFEDLGGTLGPGRQRAHATAVEAIIRARSQSQANKRPKTTG